MNVYETIKKLRKSKGLTQAEMADKLNLATSNYTLLENGKTELTYSKMLKLAEVFGVSVGELLGLEGVQSVPNGEQASEIEALKKEVERLKKEAQDLREINQMQKENIKTRSIPKLFFLNIIEQQLKLNSKDYINFWNNVKDNDALFGIFGVLVLQTLFSNYKGNSISIDTFLETMLSHFKNKEDTP
jgi:transcriptional regulator with XRE-family HTH domain